MPAQVHTKHTLTHTHIHTHTHTNARSKTNSKDTQGNTCAETLSVCNLNKLYLVVYK